MNFRKDKSLASGSTGGLLLAFSLSLRQGKGAGHEAATGATRRREHILRIASLRRFSNQPAANSRGAFPGPFISPAAGYYDRARAQARQRDVRDISLARRQ
jgi:hypothetical protein